MHTLALKGTVATAGHLTIGINPYCIILELNVHVRMNAQVGAISCHSGHFHTYCTTKLLDEFS